MNFYKQALNIDPNQRIYKDLIPLEPARRGTDSTMSLSQTKHVTMGISSSSGSNLDEQQFTGKGTTEEKKITAPHIVLTFKL